MFNRGLKHRKRKTFRTLVRAQRILGHIDGKYWLGITSVSHFTNVLSALDFDLIGLRTRLEILGTRPSREPAVRNTKGSGLRASLNRLAYRRWVLGNLVTRERLDPTFKADLDKLLKAVGELLREACRLAGMRKSETEIQRTLFRLLERCGLSGYGLSYVSGVSDRYVYRLLSGERSRPSSHVIAAISDAFADHCDAVSNKDVRSLIKAAGYSPRDILSQKRHRR